MSICNWRVSSPSTVFALGLGGVAKNHVGAIVDLHALRTTGADRHSGGREEGGRLESLMVGRKPGLGTHDRAGLLGHQRLKYQLVRLLERVASPGRRTIGLSGSSAWKVPKM